MYSRLFTLLLLASLSTWATATPGLRASRRLTGTCPSEQPEAGTSCSDVPDGGCHYDYNVQGCTVEDLQCLPSVTYTCNSETNLWDFSFRPSPRCLGPLTGSCDPDNFHHGLCPSSLPSSGSDCTNTGSAYCDYNYTVGGCNNSNGYCYAAQTAICSYNSSTDTYRWMIATATVAQCPNGSFANGSCDGTTFIPANGNGSF